MKLINNIIILNLCTAAVDVAGHVVAIVTEQNTMNIRHTVRNDYPVNCNYYYYY